jgi:hypothetical protein
LAFPAVPPHIVAVAAQEAMTMNQRVIDLPRLERAIVEPRVPQPVDLLEHLRAQGLLPQPRLLH